VIAEPFLGENSTLLEDEAIRKIVHGWMDVIGPITAGKLAQRLGLSVEQANRGLLALESAGVVLRGQFTPRAKGEAEVEWFDGLTTDGEQGRTMREPEWCERGLLARIHRLTLGRLRREIEPVTAADFIRFLLSWQHVLPMTRLRGREGVMEIIRQLQGSELPAPAWEQQVLPVRISEYDPTDLENLCLGGMVAWGRLRSDPAPTGGEEGDNSARIKAKRLRSPTRAAPLAFILRDDLPYLIEPINRPWDEIEALSAAARDVARYLEQHGASFLADIARGTGLLKTKAEEALWELVARGLVTGDGIAGLRILLTPEVKRRPRRLRVISGGRAPERLMPVGRWSLWRARGQDSGAASKENANEFMARQLLRRYGVFFRELLARETCVPSWRVLLDVYRRLEARGEIRGGRFVSGFVGEQYALPEAVDLLRAVRRSHSETKTVIVSSADPLNLVGILTPGSRISPYSNQAIVYRDGVPVDVGPLGAVRSRLQSGQDSSPKTT
jgi:ATP-dependent Lhr-like helicase